MSGFAGTTVEYAGTSYEIPKGSPSWFTSEGLPKSIFLNKKFIVPWDLGICDKTRAEGFKFMKKRLTRPSPACPKAQVSSMFPRTPPSIPASASSSTWISHATVLVKMGGITILTDPVFSPRCSPFTFAGPKRYTEPGMSIDSLPPIDIVVISHDHYDHLDTASLKKIHALQPKIRYFVPMKTKSVLTKIGIPPANVSELSWWDEREHAGARIVCTPCQHWCCRAPWDRNSRLWASWVVIVGEERFFFGGDTGR
jgi:hypothetical protein